MRDKFCQLDKRQDINLSGLLVAVMFHHSAFSMFSVLPIVLCQTGQRDDGKGGKAKAYLVLVNLLHYFPC